MPGWELIGAEERAALLDWFDSSNGVMFAHGFDMRRNGVYKVREFERALAAHFGCGHAQVVSSGTSALVVALRALGVGPGDEVVTQAFTFVATVEAILELGAVPVIAEIDESLNLDVGRLEERLSPRTRAIVPVHMAGVPARVDGVADLAAPHGLLVVEDVAQAVGGSWRGRPLGTIGDAGTLSFDFAKSLTTGEGGAVLTDDAAVYERARALHDHGHEYNPSVPRGQDTRSGPGFNFRMSEPQAAVGIVQLGKLDWIVAAQRENKTRLKEQLRSLPIEFRRIDDEDGDTGDTLVFFVESEERTAYVAARLTTRGVGTKNLPDALAWHFAGTWSHMLEIGNPPCACNPGARDCRCASLLRRAIALPVNVLMDEAEIDRVATAVAEAVS
jgi:8-amino-3,8-dideoxy-alpha-D-manno-octulosonate transaminase